MLLIGVNGNLNCFAIGNRHQAAQGICGVADQQLFRRIDFGHGVGVRVRRLFQEEEAFLIILLAEEHDLCVVLTTTENGILRLVGSFQFSFRADSAAVVVEIFAAALPVEGRFCGRAIPVGHSEVDRARLAGGYFLAQLAFGAGCCKAFHRGSSVERSIYGRKRFPCHSILIVAVRTGQLVIMGLRDRGAVLCGFALDHADVRAFFSRPVHSALHATLLEGGCFLNDLLLCSGRLLRPVRPAVVWLALRSFPAVRACHGYSANAGGQCADRQRGRVAVIIHRRRLRQCVCCHHQPVLGAVHCGRCVTHGQSRAGRVAYIFPRRRARAALLPLHGKGSLRIALEYCGRKNCILSGAHRLIGDRTDLNIVRAVFLRRGKADRAAVHRLHAVGAAARHKGVGRISRQIVQLKAVLRSGNGTNKSIRPCGVLHHAVDTILLRRTAARTPGERCAGAGNRFYCQISGRRGRRGDIFHQIAQRGDLFPIERHVPHGEVPREAIAVRLGAVHRAAVLRACAVHFGAGLGKGITGSAAHLRSADLFPCHHIHREFVLKTLLCLLGNANGLFDVALTRQLGPAAVGHERGRAACVGDLADVGAVAEGVARLCQPILGNGF